MTAQRTRTNPWHILAVLCVANFLILLDTTIVNAALPDVQRSLDAGIDEALWVLNGYLLAFASLLIVFGRLGDAIGPRRVFVAGLGLFTVASALCGVAAGADDLVWARVLQGVGAAALLPQALVLITATFPAHRRGAAFGIFTAVAGVASVSGLVVGGVLVTELGWRSVFFLSVPVGVAGIVAALRLVPAVAPARRHRLDPVGVLLATAGLSGVAYVLVEGPRHDWGTVTGLVSIPAVAALAVVCLVLFVLWERRQPEPLLPMGLFRDRNFTIAVAIALVTYFALFGVLLVLTLQLQSMLGMSPAMAGVAGLPLVLALSAVAPLAGRLTDRLGGRTLLVAGLAVYAVGVVMLALLPTTSSTALAFLLPLLVIGIGTGLTIAPSTAEAMGEIAPNQAGAAAGVLNTARQVGAVLGTAVIGAVLQNRLTGALRVEASERVMGLPDPARAPYLLGFDTAAERGLQLGGSVAVPPDLSPSVAAQFTRLVHDAFGQAFLAAGRPTLFVVAAVLLFGSALAALMPRPTPAPVVLPTPAEPAWRPHAPIPTR